MSEAQFEKVCKGLEHEMQNRGQCGHYCGEGVETVSCRYDKSGLCIQHWGKDALALIRQQQARIAELEAANKENSEWISVEDRLPTEHETIFAKLYGTDKWHKAMFRKISDDVRVVCVLDDGTRMVWHDHTVDGKWDCDRDVIHRRITHWMENPPLPIEG